MSEKNLLQFSVGTTASTRGSKLIIDLYYITVKNCDVLQLC